MTDAIESQKQEITAAEQTERTREGPCFIPRADIYEEEDQIVIVADIPGADESSIDVTLEKSILTISMPRHEADRPRKIAVKAA